MWRHGLLFGVAAWLVTITPASAFLAYVSNEKSNTVSVIDTNSWTVIKTIKVGSATARDRIHERRQARAGRGRR